MNIEDIDYPKFDAVRSLIDAQADNNPNISTAVKRVQAVSFDRLMHVFDLTMDDFRNVLATMISMDLNAIWKDRLSSSVSDTHLNDIDDNRFVKTLTKIDLPLLSDPPFKLGFWRYCRPTVAAGT